MLHQQRDRWTVLILTVRLYSNKNKIQNSSIPLYNFFRIKHPNTVQAGILSSYANKEAQTGNLSAFLHIFIHYEHLLLFPGCLLVLL